MECLKLPFTFLDNFTGDTVSVNMPDIDLLTVSRGELARPYQSTYHQKLKAAAECYH
jgi:hypothetical protein